jgi:hypothetical protein
MTFLPDDAPDDVNSSTGTAAAPALAPAPAAAPAPAVDPYLCPSCKQIHTGSDAATLKQLAQTPQALGKLLKGLDAKGWKKSYGPGKWNVRQIVAHLRDCEIAYGMRCRMMIAEPNATLTPFDQDRWAGATNYAKQDARQAFETLKLLRATNVEMLKLAGKEGLARAGIHGEYGRIDVAQMARHIVAHDRNHLAQIETARGGARKRSARR